MRKSKKALLTLLFVFLALLTSSCSGKMKDESLPELTGKWEMDKLLYAEEEGIDSEDLENCSVVFEFSEDGTVTVTDVMPAAPNSSDTVTTQASYTYRSEEKLVCREEASVTYTISGDDLLDEDGVKVGVITERGKKFSGKTPLTVQFTDGTTETWKVKLSKEGDSFTQDSTKEFTYVFADGGLTDKKTGERLGAVAALDVKDDGTADVSVTLENGTVEVYSGVYTPAKSTYTFRYANGVLYISTLNGDHTLPMRRTE